MAEMTPEQVEPRPLPVSYFPGCSGHGTGTEYDRSARQVCQALGLELLELEDWNCCGATSAHATDAQLAVALGARNLGLAEALEPDAVVTPCAACFSRLKHAQHHLLEHGTPLGLPEVKGRVQVLHLLDLCSANPNGWSGSRRSGSTSSTSSRWSPTTVA